MYFTIAFLSSCPFGKNRASYEAHIPWESSAGGLVHKHRSCLSPVLCPRLGFSIIASDLVVPVWVINDGSPPAEPREMLQTEARGPWPFQQLDGAPTVVYSCSADTQKWMVRQAGGRRSTALLNSCLCSSPEYHKHQTSYGSLPQSSRALGTWKEDELDANNALLESNSTARESFQVPWDSTGRKQGCNSN